MSSAVSITTHKQQDSEVNSGENVRDQTQSMRHRNSGSGDSDSDGGGGLVGYGTSDSESEQDGREPSSSSEATQAHTKTTVKTAQADNKTRMRTQQNLGDSNSEAGTSGDWTTAGETSSQNYNESESKSMITVDPSYSSLADSAAANHPPDVNGSQEASTRSNLSLYQQVTQEATNSAPHQTEATQEDIQRAKAYIDELMPPEPDPNAADEFVVKRFSRYMELSEQGHNFTENLRSKKEFKNPYILDRVAEHFDLDGENEYVTNYPRGLFDPSAHGPEDYYDSISYQQKIQEEFRETRKQMQPSPISFISPSTAPASSSGSVNQSKPSTSGAVDVQAATAKARAVAANLVKRQKQTSA